MESYKKGLMAMNELIVEDNEVKPGIYDNIPPHVYHNSPGISNSQLSIFADSAHLYEHHFIKKDLKRKESTASQDLGTYLHALVLEPDKANHKICKWSATADKGKIERIEARDEGFLTVTKPQYEQAQRMRDSIMKNATACAVLSKGKAEQSLYGVHEATGLLIRSRPDWRSPDAGILADIKTTKSIDTREHGSLSRDIYSYRWHVQEALYRDLEEQHGNKINEFIWIVVLNVEPYTCICAPLNKASQQQGIETYHSDMNDLMHCLKNNEWPIYNFCEKAGLSLPYYALPRDEL